MEKIHGPLKIRDFTNVVYMPMTAALATEAEGSGVRWPGVHIQTKKALSTQ